VTKAEYEKTGGEVKKDKADEERGGERN